MTNLPSEPEFEQAYKGQSKKHDTASYEGTVTF
jgi:hypothetical protein